REIFSRIGSNFLLKDGNLSIELKKPLQIISEMNESIKLEVERLEPPQIISSTTQVEALQADSLVIRRGQDSNLRQEKITAKGLANPTLEPLWYLSNINTKDYTIYLC